jgi:hypothetical protein
MTAVVPIQRNTNPLKLRPLINERWNVALNVSPMVLA